MARSEVLALVLPISALPRFRGPASLRCGDISLGCSESQPICPQTLTRLAASEAVPGGALRSLRSGPALEFAHSLLRLFVGRPRP